MPRDLMINGPLMVFVRGNPLTAIGSLSQLGMSDGPVRVRHNFRHMDVNLDAWGGEVPFEIQCKLQDVMIDMTLVHVDYALLEVCVAESIGGMGAVGVGTMPLAGARLGNNSFRFAAGNHYIGLNLGAPVNGVPWSFKHCYLTGQPFEIPLGSERSIIAMSWRCIPYIPDPFNAGLFSLGQILYDHLPDV